MNPATLIACLCLVTPVSLGMVQQHHSGAQAEHADLINTMCPVGKEPIVPSAGTVE
jgi:hypothetical protein